MVSDAYIWLLLGVATAAAVAGVCASIFYSANPERVRAAVPVSGGLLLGVALFGLLPELAADLSWTLSLVLFAMGCLGMALVDRFLGKIAGHVLIAAGLHALLDGWALTASSLAATSAVRVTLPLALVLHKLPEGLALGGILKNAMKKPWQALMAACSVEMLTLVGGAISFELSPRLGTRWTDYPLALAGGFFVFLAGHSFSAEWKRSPRFVVLTGLAGFLLSGLLQAVLRSYFGI